MYFQPYPATGSPDLLPSSSRENVAVQYLKKILIPPYNFSSHNKNGFIGEKGLQFLLQQDSFWRRSCKDVKQVWFCFLNRDRQTSPQALCNLFFLFSMVPKGAEQLNCENNPLKLSSQSILPPSTALHLRGKDNIFLQVGTKSLHILRNILMSY